MDNLFRRFQVFYKNNMKKISFRFSVCHANTCLAFGYITHRKYKLCTNKRTNGNEMKVGKMSQTRCLIHRRNDSRRTIKWYYSQCYNIKQVAQAFPFFVCYPLCKRSSGAQCRGRIPWTTNTDWYSSWKPSTTTPTEKWISGSNKQSRKKRQLHAKVV